MQLSEKLLKNSNILTYVEEKKSNTIWGRGVVREETSIEKNETNKYKIVYDTSKQYLQGN